MLKIRHIATDAEREHQIQFVDVDRLFLDEDNPRLASVTMEDERQTQEELIKILWKEMAIDELVFSIAANGFFPEETLFVVPKGKHSAGGSAEQYVVVEGNRRLAAVKVLLSTALQQKLKIDNVPRISSALREELQRLPISVYPNKKELWEFFGFRHINGPKAWDAFSKAKYVADVHEKYRISLDQIAEKIGDRHELIDQLYRGYAILKQAEQKGLFDREDRVRNRFYFSHLYTATNQQAFQKFLGIESRSSLQPDPIPKNKLGELRELMTWLYGSKRENVEPVVRTQNPDLNTLREVVAKPSSLAALRSGLSLERSFEISIGDDRRFRETLVRAKEELQQARGTVTTGYGGEADLYETMEQIILLGEATKNEMDAKIKQKKSKKKV